MKRHNCLSPAPPPVLWARAARAHVLHDVLEVARGAAAHRQPRARPLRPRQAEAHERVAPRQQRLAEAIVRGALPDEEVKRTSQQSRAQHRHAPCLRAVEGLDVLLRAQPVQPHREQHARVVEQRVRRALPAACGRGARVTGGRAGGSRREQAVRVAAGRLPRAPAAHSRRRGSQPGRRPRAPPRRASCAQASGPPWPVCRAPARG